MGDLRKPHERRSDQLSVLVRRPLSAALGTRFARTQEGLAHSPQSFRFDDFDSDTETDGPPSEHPYAATKINRRSSSASALSAVSLALDSGAGGDTPRSHVSFPPNPVALTPSPQALSPQLRTPTETMDPPPPSRAPDALTRRLTPRPDVLLPSVPPVQLRAAHAIDDDDIEDEVPFARERAKSFYGAAAAVAPDPADSDSDSSSGGTESDAGGRLVGVAGRGGGTTVTISQSRLRRALDEDYELFARRNTDTPSSPPHPPPPPPPPPEAPTSTPRNIATASLFRRPITHTHTTAEANRSKSGAATGAHSDARTSRGLLRRLVSASNICPSRRGARRSRSYLVPPDDDKAPSSADELESLIADTRAGSAPLQQVPLFVEEAGRNPRVALVNGEMRRVKVHRSSMDGGGPKPASRSMRFGRGSRGAKWRSTHNSGEKKGFALGLVRRLQQFDRKLAGDRKRKARARKEAKLDPDHLAHTTDSYSSGAKRDRVHFFSAVWARS